MISTNRLDSSDLKKFILKKYGDKDSIGWSQKYRNLFGYLSPGDHYEILVDEHVNENTKWIDVGGGSAIFPHYGSLSKELGNRCKRLVAVDPSDNVKDNPYCDEFAVCLLENYHTDDKFNLATLRMVAEHVQNSSVFCATLGRLVELDGIVIIYTINKYSPIPIITKYTPFWIHHPIKKLFWNTEEKDTFPVEYKLNTKQELISAMASSGFEVVSFNLHDDLATFSKWRITHLMELILWKFLKIIRLPYPERNILAVFRKSI